MNKLLRRYHQLKVIPLLALSKMLSCFQKEKHWVLHERGTDARDNAYFFYRYLKETHPGATSARHAGARVAKGDRLVFADDSPIGIGCELCGTMIKTGRFCAKCKAEVTNNLNSAISKKESAVAPALKKQERDPAKMRFL